MKMRQMAAVSLMALTAMAMFGCARQTKDYVTAIEQAHGVKAWDAHQALEADIEITAGGKTAFNGRLLMTTDANQAKLTSWDGPVMIWDGKQMWVSPADAKVEQATFQLRSWPYFIAAPFKLADKGTHLQPLGEKPIRDRKFDTAKLTFDPGAAEGPGDWYIVYRQLHTNLLRSLAYATTYGKTADPANQRPHAVIYNRFLLIDGVTLSTEWLIFNWNETTGITGTPVMQVALSNVRWVKLAEDTFKVPDGARLEDMPMPMMDKAKMKGM